MTVATDDQKLREAFRQSATRRLDALDEQWRGALEPDGATVSLDVIASSIRDLRAESMMVGYNDVAVLCQKVERLVEIARFGVPQVNLEVETLGGLALTFTRMLITQQGRTTSKLDLPAFAAEIDSAVDDAQRIIRLRRSGGFDSAETEARDDDSHPFVDADRGELTRTVTDLYLRCMSLPTELAGPFVNTWAAHAQHVRKLLSVSFSSREDRFRVTAHEAADAAGRTVEFHANLGNLSIDSETAAVVDRAVVQLITNAVEHGIERAAARAVLGKLPWGSVRLTVTEEADGFIVKVTDDGGGIDQARLRRQFPNLSDRERLARVFDSDYSTRSRGPRGGEGLATVKRIVDRVGGNVSIESRPSLGTTVRMRIPRATSERRAWGFFAHGFGFAVDASYAVNNVGQGGIDPRGWCGATPPPATAATGLKFSDRTGQTFAFQSDGGSQIVDLSPMFPTRLDYPLEIMSDGSRVYVFMRLDVRG